MSRFLAIDADAGGLFVASASVRGSGLQIEEAFGSLDETPANLTAANAEALGNKLKLLLKEAKISPAPALICFGRDRVIIKEVKIPPVGAGEEAAVVRFQALKDLAESADSVLMDYFPTPSPAGEVQRRATVVFIRKELFAASQTFCAAAGLKLAAVTARPFATLAAARRAIAIGAVPPPEDPQAPIAVLSLWGTGGEFAVGADHQTLFSRTISPMALGSEQALLGEMKRSIAAFNGQYGTKPVNALYLAEGDSAGTNWIGRLQANLPLPVHALDPLAGSNAAQGTAAELHGRFLGPVGLLATKTTGEKLGIDFQSPRTPRAEPNKNRRRMALFGGLAAVILAAAGVFLYLQLQAAEKKGNQLAQQKMDLEEREKAQAIENKRVDAAQQFVKREVPWLDIYYDLNDQFPTLDRVRLQEFNGEMTAAPPPLKPGQAPPKTAAPTAPTKPGGKPAEPPVGKIRLMILGEDQSLVGKLSDTMNKEPGYTNAKYSIGGLVGTSGTKVQQFTINADLLAKKPEEFKRKIVPPKLKVGGPVDTKPEEPLLDPFSFPGGGQ